MPKSKVVILNWNGAEHLRRYLPSVVASVGGEVGIVVADNGSTDDSIAWVRATYPQVEVVEMAENYGFAEGYSENYTRIRFPYPTEPVGEIISLKVTEGMPIK